MTPSARAVPPPAARRSARPAAPPKTREIYLEFVAPSDATPAAVAPYCNLETVVAAGGSVTAAGRACAQDLQVERALGANVFRNDARTLHDRGRDLQRQGRDDEARQAYALAIEADDDHQHAVLSTTALARNHLGLIERASGNLSEAHAHLKWVTENTTDPAALGTAHYNLGLVLLDQGDLESARTHILRGQTTIVAALGSQHPANATCVHALAVVDAERGALEAAVEGFSRALQLRRAGLGEQHPLTAETLTSLGIAYGRLDRWPEAQKVHEAALAIDREVLGPQHETTAVDLTYVGVALLRTGDRDRARQHFERAAAIFARTRAEDDPERLSVQAWIVSTER